MSWRFSTKTLFIKQAEVDTFNPFDEDDERLKRFSTKAETARYVSDNGVRMSEGKADVMGEERDWIRFDYSSYSIHYEYVRSKLSMMTIQARTA